MIGSGGRVRSKKLLAIASVGLFIAASGLPAHASEEPSNGQLLYSRFVESWTSEYRLLDPVTGEDSLLKRFSGEAAYEATWSPDGTSVAFAKNTDFLDIFTLSLSGELQQLTSGSGYKNGPAWSPDGENIAFICTCPYGTDAYLVDKNGQNLKQLTDTPFERDISLQWAPDGESILMLEEGRTGPSTVYAINLATLERSVHATPPFGAQEIEWSRNGDRVVYQKATEDDGFRQVFVAGPRFEDPEQLTHAAGGSFLPTWSPDGNKIAFESLRTGRAQVYVMNSDGSEQTLVTLNDAPASAPTWQGCVGECPRVVTPPEPVVYERSVTLRLTKHLIARGQIQSSASGCFSGVQVVVERQTSTGRWRELKAITTNDDGIYRARIPDKTGKHRAVARNLELSSTDMVTCAEATSSTVRHRHS